MLESVNGFSLNALAGALADRMAEAAAQLRIHVQRGTLGERLIDCGANVPGGIEAGLRLAAISMGGIGTVSLVPSELTPRWPWHVAVRSSDPVAACLASQYAGWALKHEDKGGGFSALGSGPARALARKEAIFDELAHRERCDRAVLVVEADAPPPAPVIEEVAADCGLSPERLTVLFAPTRSLAGAVQVAARVVEVALSKARQLEFPLDRILDAAGSAPLSPPHPDLATAMGRTNDAIIYGGRAHLFVTGPEVDAERLAAGLPSFKSRDYGEPFANIFRRVGGDFYAIDPLLFSPARATVTAVDTGASFHGGTISAELLDASFG
ncbi:MAG: methenyltetrahydromethanopterin cyclohydrolase [Rhizobiales bacterium]|nr:methenyltetrahydromethanopterin cyclohydrolase [Hyphomicrobiales bacterium]